MQPIKWIGFSVFDPAYPSLPTRDYQNLCWCGTTRCIPQHPSAPHKGIRFHYPHFPVSHRTLIPVCMFRWAFKRACQYLVDILGGLPRHNKAREETDSRSYFYTPDHLKAPFPHAAPILAHGCGTHKQWQPSIIRPTILLSMVQQTQKNKFAHNKQESKLNQNENEELLLKNFRICY